MNLFLEPDDSFLSEEKHYSNVVGLKNYSLVIVLYPGLSEEDYAEV